MLSHEAIWAGVGLLGQGVFAARFLVQWIASERQRETVMPVAFWWLSLTGGLITLSYAIHLQSAAFTLGQGMGLFVYVRNLMLVRGANREDGKPKRRQTVGPAPAPHAAREPRVDAGVGV